MEYFTGSSYWVRKKILKIFGGAFHIYDAAQNVVGFAEMAAFKLKEEFVMYSDETKRMPIFSIKARNILDFSAAYDVYDCQTRKKLGVFKRKGFKSMIKDEWIIMDEHDREIGMIKEDSILLALFRRLATNLLPQKYNCEMFHQQACTYKQNFNPFVIKIGVEFNPTSAASRSLLMAGALLLCAIEGKQEDERRFS